MQTTNLKPVLLSLTLRQREEIKAEAQNLGISFTDMTRRILDAYLDQKIKPTNQ